MMTTDQLIAKYLHKSYRSRLIVNKLSLQINSGDITGLLGPNGAGKTTAFYMIAGLISTDQGNIWLNEREITFLPLHLRAKLGIGYLPQEACIFRKLTVKENILAALELASPNHQEISNRLAYLLEEFRLTTISDTLGMSLSGGERRRTEIARLLALQPKFILLDEPFAGIDPLSIMDIKQIIRLLASQGIGILITDHNVRETLTICKYAYILHHGTILYEGSPQMILDNAAVRAVYLGEEFNL